MLAASDYTTIEALERLRHEIGAPTAGTALDVLRGLTERLHTNDRSGDGS